MVISQLKWAQRAESCRPGKEAYLGASRVESWAGGDPPFSQGEVFGSCSPQEPVLIGSTSLSLACWSLLLGCCCKEEGAPWHGLFTPLVSCTLAAVMRVP